LSSVGFIIERSADVLIARAAPLTTVTTLEASDQWMLPSLLRSIVDAATRLYRSRRSARTAQPAMATSATAAPVADRFRVSIGASGVRSISARQRSDTRRILNLSSARLPHGEPRTQTGPNSQTSESATRIQKNTRHSRSDGEQRIPARCRSLSGSARTTSASFVESGGSRIQITSEASPCGSGAQNGTRAAHVSVTPLSKLSIGTWSTNAMAGCAASVARTWTTRTHRSTTSWHWRTAESTPTATSNWRTYCATSRRVLAQETGQHG
jgi:hypothetical protein